MGLRKPQTAATPPDAAEALLAVTTRLVEQVRQIQGLREELASCEAAYRAQFGGYVAMPLAYCGPLFQAADRTQYLWLSHRPELVGGPPQPSREAIAVVEARAEVERATEMLKGYQQRLDRLPGGTSEGRRELQRSAESWAQNLQRSRQRLGDCLAALPQDSDVRRERLDLQDARSSPVIVSVAM